jgi:DNA-binding transcriptional regulator YhcF (GntR family)
MSGSSIEERLCSYSGYGRVPRVFFRLDGNLFKVYCGVFDCCRGSGKCCVSIQHLSNKLAMSRRTVQRSLQQLEGLDIISITRINGKSLEIDLEDLNKKMKSIEEKKKKAEEILSISAKKSKEIQEKVLQKRLDRTKGKLQKGDRDSLPEESPTRVVIESYRNAFLEKYEGTIPLPVFQKKELGQAKMFANKVADTKLSKKIIFYVFRNWDKLKRKWKLDGYPTMGILLVYGINLTPDIFDSVKVTVEKDGEKSDGSPKFGW